MKAEIDRALDDAAALANDIGERRYVFFDGERYVVRAVQPLANIVHWMCLPIGDVFFNSGGEKYDYEVIL